MNWNLHAGNKCLDTKRGEYFFLDYPFRTYNNVNLIKDTADIIRFPENCKPVVKPLTALTEEEKKAFREEFGYTEVPGAGLNLKEIYLDNDIKKRPRVVLSFGYCVTEATTREIHWLMERGYNVGQFKEGEYIEEAADVQKTT